jgi:long-chain acyl-CoA synthetase
MFNSEIDDRGRTLLPAAEAILRGMGVAIHARANPDRLAIEDASGPHSFAELNARANQLVRGLRARGLEEGDAVALLCSNRVEFVEVYAAVLRGGFRLTPINWHLTAGEIGYIVDDCEAKAFVADARFAETAHDAAKLAPRAVTRYAIDGSIAGFEDYAETLGEHSGNDLTDPVQGNSMLYTSGTTGRPKGVFKKGATRSVLLDPIMASSAFRPGEDRSLITGPLYHAAPLVINMAAPLAAGVGSILMDSWDAEQTLRLIESRRITHSHLVPTMFHRMLKLPEEIRNRYDLSSLRWIVHGAAPCPEHVKAEMIRWWGPILYEYYAATEGGGFWIDSAEWLRKPGSVGCIDRDRFDVSVLDEAGEDTPRGEIGTVYFKASATGRFEYFKAPEKTASVYRGDFFTMGDLGRIDQDGYLFLTGRSAELILSGGVNIYPAEVDAVLLQHAAVADAATIGVPNEEWGEEVKAVVQLAEGTAPSDSLAAELIAYCREHLAHYKCPRSLDFEENLPRLDSGKIQRGKVRDRYL